MSAVVPKRLTERRPSFARENRVCVLLVGTGSRAAEATRELTAKGKFVVGALDDCLRPDLQLEYPDIPYFGPLDEIRRVVQQGVVDEVCLTLPWRSCFDQCAFLFEQVAELGFPISLTLDFFRGLKITRTKRVGNDVVSLALNQSRSVRRPQRLFKRAFDLAVGGLAIALLSPLLIALSLAVKLTSAGPVLFRQERIGRGLRSFSMYKFRTMVKDAEELRSDLRHMNSARGISFKIVNDPRVTRLGRLLRRSSLDELPQLLNVILGDMSLVGPRPIPLWVAEQLEHTEFHRRFTVLPGLTGLWQVEGRTQDFDAMGNKDLEYVDNWSFWLDLKIIAQTPLAMIRGEGVC